ncbi:hypothetical protein BpHYR1_012661 [Brachionus plicatilis]|uniref:Uncharacterized protein n=1 Tax=Brachionus plicatilis TaxID=10195 RepID=A0A3M7SUU0_BRAPC|nr:hypothetical protein BpHYR1_012661 [Brachionus plicatilis]
MQKSDIIKNNPEFSAQQFFILIIRHDIFFIVTRLVIIKFKISKNFLNTAPISLHKNGSLVHKYITRLPI